MTKLLFITMGSSLFQSASWDPDRLPASELRSYSRKARKSAFLDSPEERSRLQAVRGELESTLDGTNPEKWAGCLPEDLRRGAPRRGTAMRYSAELATLIQLAEEEVDRGEVDSLRELLKSWEKVFLVVDPEDYGSGAGEAGGEAAPAGEGLSYVAGKHLRRYLETILDEEGERDGFRTELLPVPGIASREAERLLGEESGVRRLLGEIRSREGEHRPDHVDFVVTGGYKLYGMVLAQLAVRAKIQTRLLYLYEKGDQLLQLTSRHIRMKGRRARSGMEEFAGLGRTGS